jgi:hypothetical protein
MSRLLSTLGTLVIVLILFALLLVVTLVIGIGVVLVGRALALVSGLSVFEASLIALGIALMLGTGFVMITRSETDVRQGVSDLSEDEFDEDEDEDLFEDEEDEEPLPPPPAAKEFPLGRRTPYHVEPPPHRNDPCPCGSGRKYKNCHGKQA